MFARFQTSAFPATRPADWACHTDTKGHKPSGRTDWLVTLLVIAGS